MTDPVEAPHEIKVPGLAAELSVCDDFEAQFFLLGNQVTDSRIFHFFQSGSGDFTLGELFPGGLQWRRTKETADKIGPECRSSHIYAVFARTR